MEKAFHTKRPQIFLLLILLLFFPGPYSLAISSEGTARDEGGLSKEEARSIVGRIFKREVVSVLQVKEGPIRGLWEIIFETDSGKSILYIDSTRQYFLGGPILSIRDHKNMTEESLISCSQVKRDVSSIPLDDALILGDPSGRKRVIAFLSPTCRACGEMLKTFRNIADRREGIVFYLKILPFSREDDGFRKAESILSRRSLDLLERSLAGEPIPGAEIPAPGVVLTMAEAEKLGVFSTPTLILGDGTVLEGAVSEETLLSWIARHSN